MNKKILLVFLAGLFLLLTTQLAYADRGIIPIDPDVSVYEPGQKAIIAWNGETEILILSTDVTSIRETKVVEILPLPSKPESVEAASFHSFEEIQKIIFQYISEYAVQRYGAKATRALSEEIEVVFHEKIGAHDITVVKASDPAVLVGWIDAFLAENGVDKEVSLGRFEPVVAEYMARGFRFYVLDIIDASSKKRSIEPILYKFNSSFLYYPLKITSPLGGNTKITLFIITEDLVKDGYYPFREATFQASKPEPMKIKLCKGELSKIDLRIGEIFSGEAWLTILLYEGDISRLDEDLILTEKNFTQASPLSPLIPYVVLGVLCTLAGSGFTLLFLHSKKK